MLDSPARTRSWWGVFVSLLAVTGLIFGAIVAPSAQAQSLFTPFKSEKYLPIQTGSGLDGYSKDAYVVIDAEELADSQIGWAWCLDPGMSTPYVTSKEDLRYSPNDAVKFEFRDNPEPVSYTHLTLPTIYSV